MKIQYKFQAMACFIVLTAALASFQNCSKAKFNTTGIDTASALNEGSSSEDTTGIDIGVPDPVDPEIIDGKCKTGVQKTASYQVSFLDPGKVCEWGEKGNLSKKNHFFRARRKQTFEIDLPENATICDADFEFSEQEFWYDDVFILSLDTNVLVSSYKFDEIFERENGFFQYDWDELVGAYWDHDNKSEDYCAGSADGLSECSFPAQHEVAPINLELQPKLLRNAMANSGYIKHTFNMVTVGDNDKKDCRHFDMEFKVNLTYVD